MHLKSNRLEGQEAGVAGKEGVKRSMEQKNRKVGRGGRTGNGGENKLKDRGVHPARGKSVVGEGKRIKIKKKKNKPHCFWQEKR